MRLAIAAAVLAATLGSSLRAQDVIPKVEYQGGHAGMNDKVKGSLVITPTEIRFLDNHGGMVFTIPVASVTRVESSIERKEASVGSKLAFGFLAKSRKDEFVTVTYESSTTAEGVVFRTDKNVSAGVVAKIRFQQDHAGAAANPPTAGTTSRP